MLRLLRARDYGGAADVVMSILTKVACDGAKCTAWNEKAITFVHKFAVYTIDSIRSGSASTSASSNFRSAAVVLIDSVSGLGLSRAPRIWRDIWLPRFALRKGARPGSGRTDLVSYPSVDIMTLRFVPYSTPSFQLHLAFSALDLVGGFTELGVRAPELQGKSNGYVFGLGFVTPRVDVELGVPGLTKHLVVGAGLGVRFFRADSSAADGSMIYCTVADCHDNAVDNDYFDENNLDYSIFIKFVP